MGVDRARPEVGVNDLRQYPTYPVQLLLFKGLSDIRWSERGGDAARRSSGFRPDSGPPRGRASRMAANDNNYHIFQVKKYYY